MTRLPFIFVALFSPIYKGWTTAMAVHIDHVSISSQNIYVGAFKLREETSLGFYDGGFFAGGLANRIFPLGGISYLEIGGIVQADCVKDPKTRPWWYDKVKAAGECFTGLCFRVDSMEELREIAAKKNYTMGTTPIIRTRPNGSEMRAFTAPGGADTWPKGLPNWYYFEEFTKHPSGQPVFTWPGMVRPTGIAWLEVGGSEAQMTEWLGLPASNFPFKFNGKVPGLYAVGVNSDKGEIVIRRKAATEV
jgi:Glyoxalase-like domain